MYLKAIAAPAPRALPPFTENKIRALLKAPDVQSGHIGVLISALGTAQTSQVFPSVPYDNKTQPVLFVQDADKRFLPASNMKLFTSAMALKVLGPEKTFATRVLKFEDSIETLDHCVLFGGGDPSLDDKGLQILARQIKAAGVLKVPLLLADGSAFGAEDFNRRYPSGWTLDDTVWYYGPEINALAYNRNQVDVTLIGSEKLGSETKMEISPLKTPLKIFNAVKTENTKPRGEETITIDRTLPLDGKSDSVLIHGSMAPKEKIELGLALPSPIETACQSLAMYLREAGIPVEKAKASEFSTNWGPPVYRKPHRFRELARHESPPLKELLKRLLKNSDNLYAEMLLRAAALESVKKTPDSFGELYPQFIYSETSFARRGHQLIFDWLKENKISTEGLSFSDGSGLSRYNMVTPRAVSGLLSAAERLPGGDAFWNALPIAGVDGTMRNRGKGTAIENNVRAKSGTFSIVSCLSGYVTTKDKQRLSVVILTNFVPNGSAARRLQDEIFTALAEAEWKVN